MKFKQILRRLFGRGQQEPSTPQSDRQPGQSEMLQKLLTMLSNTQAVELSCDEVFAVLDQFAELAARGENVAQLMPLVKQHLDMCADCWEEYKVLESILENTA